MYYSIAHASLPVNLTRSLPKTLTKPSKPVSSSRHSHSASDTDIVLRQLKTSKPRSFKPCPSKPPAKASSAPSPTSRSQYYIGSQAAHNYLKAIRWYEGILDEIVRWNPELRQKHNLSLKKINRLISSVKHKVEDLMTLNSVMASSPEDLSLASLHEIITGRETKKRVQEDGLHLWKLNYARVISNYLAETPRGSDQLDASPLLMVWLMDRFVAGNLRLLHVATGKCVTAREVFNDATLRRGTAEEFWVLVREIIDGEAEDKKPTLTDVELNQLRDAYAESNLAVAHRIVKQRQANFYDLGKGRWHLEDIIVYDATDGSEPGSHWLYDDMLYERADREYILGHRDIERRIVLNAIKGSWWTNWSSLQSGLDELTKQHKKRMHEARAKLENLLADTSEDRRSHLIRKMQKERYLYLALVKNRPWLIEFLSR